MQKNKNHIFADKVAWIEACRKEDKQALELLYRTYAPKMKRICLHYIPNKQVAEDLCHDGFILIFTQLHTLQSPDRLEGWMAAIMKNLCLQYLKHNKAQQTTSINYLQEQEEPEDNQQFDELPSYDTLMSLINSLPEGYKQVFKLSVLEGMSHTEIGALLHIAPHSSSSQLSRAKEMLRKLLAEHHYTSGWVLFAIGTCLFFFWNNKEKEAIPTPPPPIINTLPQKPNALSPLAQKDNTIHSSDSDASPARRAHTAKEDTIPLQAVPHKIIPLVKPLDNLSSKNTVAEKCHNPKETWTKAWNASFTYDGGKKLSDERYLYLPGDITSDMPKEQLVKAYHHIPLSFALNLHRQLNKHWGLETGLQYSYLRSDFTTESSDYYSRTIQRVHYLGIPLKATFNVWHSPRLAFYTFGQATLDIPLHASRKETRTESGYTYVNNSHPSSSMQWSVGSGIGFQYRLTPSIHLYTEPTMHYYFNRGNHPYTIRNAQPLGVSVPVGIRFSW